MPTTAIPKLDFSLTPAGPFASLLRTLGLIDRRRGGVARTALVCAALAWLPMMAACLVERLSGAAVDPLCRDFSVHVRALVAIPLLFLAEAQLHALWNLAADHFATSGFVDGPDATRIERIFAQAASARSSATAEAVCLLIALVAGQLSLWGVTQPAGMLHGATFARFSAARIVYTVIGLPLFQFLLARLLWRWLVWSWALLRLSRLPLRPVATHPDHAGGLAHLAEPTRAFACFAFALSAVAASAWVTQVVYAKVAPTAFIPNLVLLVVVACVLAFGPLLAFSRHLYRARLLAVEEYSHLGLHIARLFHRRWIERGDDPSILGTQDVSQWCDLGTAYDTLDDSRAAVFSLRDVITVVAATVVPMLPLVLTRVPLRELALDLIKSVVG